MMEVSTNIFLIGYRGWLPNIAMLGEEWLMVNGYPLIVLERASNGLTLHFLFLWLPKLK